MNQEEIRFLYSEFKGYLGQLPMPKDPHENMYDEGSWNQYNEAVNEVSRITGKSYSKFLIRPTEDYVNLTTFRQKLNALILRLHAEYFSNEPEPFSGGPGIVISQTQQQNQSVLLQIVLDIQGKIDEKLPSLKDGTKEKNFFQKLRSTLGGTQNVIGLISQILTLAREFGVPIESLSELFK